MSAPLLSLVLAIASPDGAELQLALETAKNATVSIAWGELHQVSTSTGSLHYFGRLPAPMQSSLAVRLQVGSLEYDFVVPKIEGTEHEIVLYERSRLSPQIEQLLRQNLQFSTSSFIVTVYAEPKTRGRISTPLRAALLVQVASAIFEPQDSMFSPNDNTLRLLKPVGAVSHAGGFRRSFVRLGSHALVLLPGVHVRERLQMLSASFETLGTTNPEIETVLFIAPNIPSLEDTAFLDSLGSRNNEDWFLGKRILIVGSGVSTRAAQYQRTRRGNISFFRTSNHYPRGAAAWSADLRRSADVISSNLLNYLVLESKETELSLQAYALEGTRFDHQDFEDQVFGQEKEIAQARFEGWIGLLGLFLTVVLITVRLIRRGPYRLKA